MENAIIIRSNGQFKSKALNTATAGLAKAFQNIENGRKEACVILARVEKTKAYKDDGFESLAQYAETIGLEKSLAHKMENAGRLLISENPDIKAFADKTDFSKLAILSSADEKKVTEAIQAGELTPETTQAGVKAWKANNNTKEGKEKILPKYEVFGVYGTGNTFHYEAIEIENVKELDNFVKVGTFEIFRDYDSNGNKISEDGDKWTVYGNPDSGEMLRVRVNKVKVTKSPVKSAKNMTFEELKKLAESMGYTIG